MNPITLRTAAGRVGSHRGSFRIQLLRIQSRRRRTNDRRILGSALGFGVDPEQRPSGSGIPLLFPFPGRWPGTSFTWQDKTYPLKPPMVAAMASGFTDHVTG
ncbi:MAG: hypothetical protein R3C99_01600 [Pirellulaceae bacterium]